MKFSRHAIHNLVSFSYVKGQHADQSKDLGAKERFKNWVLSITLYFSTSDSVGSDGGIPQLLIQLAQHKSVFWQNLEKITSHLAKTP